LLISEVAQQTDQSPGACKVLLSLCLCLLPSGHTHTVLCFYGIYFMALNVHCE
jgi:hypothetical protein